jgi:pimeloyl-ACP methyl ester carboxylesterase
MKTYAPSATNRCAVASPMPLFPPVMTAIFPSSFFMIFAFLEIDVKEVINDLNSAYADEWLAHFQYFLFAQVIEGIDADTLKKESMDELNHAKFAVLGYDKRDIGEGSIIVDTNVWGNMTINDLIEDSKKALNVLLQQPEVDPDKVSILGHSEGTIIAPRVAIDNPTKVKNIVLMGTVAQNGLDLEYYQDVVLPIEYANQVLDKNHTGLISIQQVAKDPILLPILSPKLLLIANDTEAVSSTLAKGFGTNDFISIDKQLKPVLMKGYENITSSNLLQCNQIECPNWFRSHSKLIPALSVIGNVSNSAGILMLNGENDSQTPVEQAFLLQQRLTDVKHPDHSLITYPNLGHVFYPSSQWQTRDGPIPQYVLADLYAWLEAHSGFTNYAVAAHIPTSSAKR